MAEVNFYESDYRFHSPVRYFTANDPYYWEVDNIPLQQLMENDLWLRDQVRTLSTKDGVDRRDFNELKPYVNNTDNLVRVKPGRFTARINDTTASLKFMTIQRIAGELFSERPTWRLATYNTPGIKDNIDKIVSEVADDATFMNGLMERAFTYPSKDPFTPYVDYRAQTNPWNPALPLKDISFWTNGNEQSITTSNWVDWRSGGGFTGDTQLQPLFMKFWRGIARTAVVDVPEELSIEIPAFNIADFDYFDENGNSVRRDNAEVRIDLVFIYSKPIDALESRVIDKTSGNGIRVINKAELGIVKGAGAIFSKAPTGDRIVPQFDDGGQDENGNTQIVASVADSKTTAGGFTASGIHGSFPSPDDLMNVAPLIAEQLETNDPLLIGQSILPVAYIVVRKDTSTNANGVQVLSDTSLVDIRPFFRTTELTYSERAGIAAAIPQLSISNPVVSKLELRYETKRLFEDYTSKFAALQNTGSSEEIPRIVGNGYILGGNLHGVEAVLHDMYTQTLGQKTPAELNAIILARHGYNSNLIIPELPDWDIAKWALSVDDPGFSRNDYINTYYRQSDQNPNDLRQYTDYGFYTDADRDEFIRRFGSDRFEGNANIHFVKKTIRIAKPGWMGDYFVNAQFLNCVPLSNRYNSIDDRTFPGAADIWISKRPDRFTIYCAWVAEGNDVGGNSTLPYFNRDSKNYGGFFVMTDEIYAQTGLRDALTGSSRSPKESRGGVALYPSITFQVVGVPTNYAGTRNSFAGVEPLLNLT